MVAQGVQLCKAGGGCCRLQRRESGDPDVVGNGCLISDGSLAGSIDVPTRGTAHGDASTRVPVHTHKSRHGGMDVEAIRCLLPLCPEVHSPPYSVAW